MGRMKNFVRRILPSSKKQVTDRTNALERKIDGILNFQKRLEAKIARLEKTFSENLMLAAEKIEEASEERGEFERRFERLFGEGKKFAEESFSKMDESFSTLETREEGIAEKVSVIEKSARAVEAGGKALAEKIEALEEKSFGRMDALDKSLAKKAEGIFKNAREALEFSRECNWADVFNSTVSQSQWLLQKDFSLGRWAIGYQCAYVLYRVLNETRPKNILELGLGQSTKLISQYVQSGQNVCHKVFENNSEWIDFFSKNYLVPKNTQIVHCDWTFEDFDGVEKIRVFEKFEEKIKGQKFDLIMIDAPLGGDMPNFARIDVLKCIPQCLAKSFVLILDDAERSGEKGTIEKIKRKMEEAKMDAPSAFYWGKKGVWVMASSDLKFVLTM